MAKTTYQYSAFISYKHKDKPWAIWLKNKLENCQLPVSSTHKRYCRIYEGATPYLDGLPCKHPSYALRDVFRDEQNAGCGSELNDVLRQNIEKSKFLIVICSPASKTSSYVAEEINYFKQTHPDSYQDAIIPLIVAGTVDAQNNVNECFPQGLSPTVLGSSVKKRFGWTDIRYKYKLYKALNSLLARFAVFSASKEKSLSKIIGPILSLDPDKIYQSRKKAIRKKRRVIGFCLSAIVATVVFCYFYYFHTYTHYYANYVERNGIPDGISPLDTEELPLQFQYYEFKIRNGLVREVLCKDASGQLTMPQQPLGLNNAPKQIYEYTPNRLVSKIICEEDSETKAVISFPGVSRDIIQLNSQIGEAKYLYAEDNGAHSRIHHIRTTRNEKGEITQMAFFTNADKESLGELSNGVGRQTISRAENGLILSIKCLDSQGNTISWNKGTYEERYSYDSRNRFVGSSVFGEQGEPVYDKDFVHKTVSSGIGSDSITLSYSGTEGKPCLNSECVASVSRVTRANTTAIYYFDQAKKPTISKSLIACCLVERNPKSGSTKESYFDTSGHLTLCKDGYAIRTTTHSGDSTTLAYYDINMQPCYGHDDMGNGCAIYRTTTIGNNGRRAETYTPDGIRCTGPWGSPVMEQFMTMHDQIDSCAYFDGSGKPFPIRGTAFIKFLYDSFGNNIEVRNYDKSEGLTYCIFYSYDSQGNRTQEWIDNAMGQPIVLSSYEEKYDFADVAPDDIHKICKIYDRYGRIIETIYYGAQNNKIHSTLKTYDKFGNVSDVAVEYDDNNELNIYLRMEYDSLGKNITRTSLRNKDRKLKEIYGIAILEKQYDRRNNLVSIKAYDRANKLTIMPTSIVDRNSPKAGVAICQQFFNDQDLLVETRFFDKAMQPCASTDFSSVIKHSYNEKRLRTETAYFHQNKPYKISNFHKQRFEYNGQQSTTITCLDENDKLVNSTLGYAKITINGATHSQYDKDGHLLYYGYYQDPIELKNPLETNGYHRCIIEYNADFSRNDEKYYNKFGERCTNSEHGASRITTYFNAKNLIKRQEFRDSLDNLTDGESGFAILKKEYDHLNREIKTAVFHADYTPATITSGLQVAASYYTFDYLYEYGMNLRLGQYYDSKGRKVEQSIALVANNRLVDINDAPSKYIWRYNKMTDKLDSLLFYDANNHLQGFRTYKRLSSEKIMLTDMDFQYDAEHYFTFFTRKSPILFEISHSDDQNTYLVNIIKNGKYLVQEIDKQNKVLSEEILSAIEIDSGFGFRSDLFD